MCVGNLRISVRGNGFMYKGNLRVCCGWCRNLFLGWREVFCLCGVGICLDEED